MEFMKTLNTVKSFHINLFTHTNVIFFNTMKMTSNHTARTPHNIGHDIHRSFVPLSAERMIALCL